MSNLDILKKTKEALDRAIAEKKITQEMVRSLSPAIIETITPVLQEIANNSKINKKDILDALSQLKIDVPKTEVEVKMPDIRVPEANVKVEMPKIEIPEIKIPPIKVPIPKVTVNVPEIEVPAINVPDMKWPEGNMPIDGFVSLKGVDRKNPLPVELRDADGNPMRWPEYIGGGGGGASKVVKIGGFIDSLYAQYLNADNRLRVSVEGSGGGLTDTELRAAHLDVQQVSGAIDSVNVLQIAGNNAVVGSGYQDNALRVVNATDAITSIRIAENAAALDVLQVSGSVWSVSVNDMFRTTVASTLINSDDRLRVSLETGGSGLTDAELRAAHLDVQQLSGAVDSVKVTSFDTSVAASIVDSGGVQYSGSNPLPIAGNVNVNGALNSILATGTVLHDAADDGDAPLKMGGIAMTDNPTAVAGGDRAALRTDDLGRLLIRPVQVRDLIQTAYVSISNGTETTLLAGAASTFHDLLYVMMSNSSDAAVLVDLRSGTGNGVVATVQVPASGLGGASLNVPIPQDVAANAWTVDMPDITGTTVYISALFSKEI